MVCGLWFAIFGRNGENICSYAREDRNGSIACAGCGFRAEAAYGPDTLGMIEIHHTKPLFLRGGVGLRTSIAAALRHVAPLCPNCHRVVHMDRARCMPISELTLLIAQHSQASAMQNFNVQPIPISTSRSETGESKGTGEIDRTAGRNDELQADG
jgi:hypothetical protein